MSDVVAQMKIQVDADIAALQKKMDDLEKDMRDAGEKGAGSLNDAIGTVVSSLGLASAAAKVFGTLLKGIEYNKMAEQAKVSFGVLLGSVNTATKVLGEFRALAMNTPLEFTDIRAAGQQLIAFGISAEEATASLRMIGDVATGVGAPLQDMAYLYGTIKTQGRAMTQDLMQFANRGIPIFESLAKVMNVSVSEVRNLASEGKIGFPEIEAAFKSMTAEGGKFYNMMELQSKTLAGAQSNLKDSIDGLIGKLSSGLMGPLKALVDLAAGLVSFVGSLPTPLVAVVGALTGLAAAAAVAVAAFTAFTALAPMVTAAFVSINAAMGPIGWAIAGGVAVVTAAIAGMSAAATEAKDNIIATYGAIAEEVGVVGRDAEASAKKVFVLMEKIEAMDTDGTLTAKSFEALAKATGLAVGQVAQLALKVEDLSASGKEMAMSMAIAYEKEKAAAAERAANQERELARLNALSAVMDGIANRKAALATLDAETTRLATAGLITARQGWEIMKEAAQGELEMYQKKVLSGQKLTAQEEARWKVLNNSVATYDAEINKIDEAARKKQEAARQQKEEAEKLAAGILRSIEAEAQAQRAIEASWEQAQWDQADMEEEALRQRQADLVQQQKDEQAAADAIARSWAQAEWDTIDQEEEALKQAREDRIRAEEEAAKKRRAIEKETAAAIVKFTQESFSLMKGAADAWLDQTNQAIDAETQKRLEAAGLVEETKAEQLAREIAEAEAAGDTTLAAEKRRELERQKIMDDAEKKKKKAAYDAAVFKWNTEQVMTIVETARAVAEALPNPVASVLAGIAGAAQLAIIRANPPPPPAYAVGTDFHPGGLALVGERGPEMVQLPRGASVATAAQTAAALSGSGGQTITVNNYSPEALDPVRSAELTRRSMQKLAFEGVFG